MQVPPPLQAVGARLRATLAAKPLDPPSRKELAPDALGHDVLQEILQRAERAQVAAEHPPPQKRGHHREDHQEQQGQVLQKDPGNPLALNNMAAIMVKQKKFDKADTYLNQALPKAKGYMVQINRVCTVGGICSAFKPVEKGTGNQDLEPLIKMNIDMVKQYMSAQPLPGSGIR